MMIKKQSGYSSPFFPQGFEKALLLAWTLPQTTPLSVAYYTFITAHCLNDFRMITINNKALSNVPLTTPSRTPLTVRPTQRHLFLNP